MIALFALIGFIVVRGAPAADLPASVPAGGIRQPRAFSPGCGESRGVRPAPVARRLLALFVAQLRRSAAPCRGWSSPRWPALACLAVAAFERDPRKTAKKPLAMTRAPSASTASRWRCSRGAAASPRRSASDLVLVVDRRRCSWCRWRWSPPICCWRRSRRGCSARYWHEAHAKLRRIDPIVDRDHRLLRQDLGQAHPRACAGNRRRRRLITPGSVNTAMGIARMIRERLQPHHRYFVVEMGAYGIGSIRRLCALTPPKLGIITAIGKAHYERFKSLDAVARRQVRAGRGGARQWRHGDRRRRYAGICLAARVRRARIATWS